MLMMEMGNTVMVIRYYDEWKQIGEESVMVLESGEGDLIMDEALSTGQ